MGYKGRAKVGALAAAALTLLLLPLPALAPVAPAEAQAGSAYTPTAPGVAYEWWGPTDAAGWHFRVPVLIEPKLPDPLTKWGVASDFNGGSVSGLQDTPVQIELDFTRLVRDTNAEGAAGWPMDEFGRLSSFTFDPATVRVVAYDRQSGRVDPAQGRAGLMPAMFSPSLFLNEHGLNPVYNATQNAVGTLQWIVDGPFTQERLYFVYFDTVENGKKPAVEWTEREIAPLRALHFTRSGTDLYGYFPAIANLPPARIYIHPIYANTTVTMYRYRHAGFEPQDILPCDKGTVGMCLRGGILRDDRLVVMTSMGTGSTRQSWQVTTDREPPNEPFFFRIEASKPVVATIGPRDPADTHQTSFWAPSLDAGLLGQRFAVPMLTASHNSNNRNPPNGLVVVGGDKDTQLQILVSGGGQGTFVASFKARSVMRFDNYQSGATVFVNSLVNDAPVMVGSLPRLSHHGNQALSQYGTPVGTTLFTATTRTTGLNIIPHTETGVTLFNLEDPSRSFPTDGPYGMEAGPHNAWRPAEGIFEHHDSTIWSIRSSGQASAIAGDRGLFPIGGVDARDFQFVLRSSRTIYPVEARAFVMPIYPQTRVEVEEYDERRGRYVQIYARNVGPDAPVMTRPGSGEPLMTGNVDEPGAYRVRSSKPVFVWYYAEENTNEVASSKSFPYQTFLGGRTRSPLSALGAVEFYGPLVSWKDRLEQRTVKPGEQVVATFTVTNLGKAHDGRGVPDDIAIFARATEGSPLWTTRLSTAFEAQVPGGNERHVTVVVDVPEDAKTDETLDLELVATSGINPRMRDVAVLQITVQTRYEIDITFRANNRNTLQSIIDPGDEREYLIRARNLGSGDDAVYFTMLRQNPFGFEADVFFRAADGSRGESFLDQQGLARIGLDGRPVSLPLAVGEEKDVILVVKAPNTNDPAQHNFVIEGGSASDSSSRKQLTFTALTNARTALSLRPLDELFEVTPGVNATLAFEVVNEGVETVVEMTYRAAEIPGWNITLDPPLFELRAPGVLDPRDDSPLDRRVVNLSVRAGPDARVGFLMPIEVTAASATRLGDVESQAARQLITARVVNNFTILMPEILERSALPGDVLRYEIPLKSLANGNFTLEPVVTRVPRGWSVGGLETARVALAPETERTVTLTLTVEPNAPAGPYDGDFGFVLEDEDSGRRNITTVPFHVRVRRHVDLEAVLDRPVLVAPTASTRASFHITNTGNVNITLELGANTPPGWTAALLDQREAVLDLAPGESRTVDLRITAPERPSSDLAAFELVGAIALEREIVTPFNVTVIRDDLAILSVESLTRRFRVGEPAVFQVTVVNQGTVPRSNIGLALVVDGVVARNVTIGSLAPNEPRAVQVPWNVVSARDVAFVIDPREEFHEEDVENNVRTFDLRAARREAALPGPSVLLLLALVGAAALLLDRRRR